MNGYNIALFLLEYIFHFLSPNAYPEFFDYIKNQKILDGQHKFRCELENMLEE